MKKIILFILIIGLTVSKTLTQTFDKTKLDNYFNALEANNKFMGSVAISKNGTIVYTRQTGYSDIEDKIKPNDNTKYKIGSISKTFTTVLIFKVPTKESLN